MTRFTRPLDIAPHPDRPDRRAAARLACAIVALACAWPAPAPAQMGGMGGGMGGMMGGFGAVGGISIDADGIIRNLDPKALDTLAKERRQAIAGGAGRPGGEGTLRKVSLAGIIAAVNAAGKDRQLPPDVVFMGGLQRVTHVFVDPEGHDIILAGPGEALAVDAAGTVVGASSGRPLLQLEDLIVALRSIDAVRSGGIKCSIDPTPDGIVRLQTLLRSQRTIGQNPEATLVAMQNAVGDQRVTVGGVPGDSRFSRVLVAADYRLKRIGMGLEPSGVPQLPSYLSMAPAGGAGGTALPRFWLEPDYDPLSRDPDELAWRINGRRIRCLTENDLFDAEGTRKGRGAADQGAEKWCQLMTAHYDDVARRQPVFAELVGCVDLAVVAALVHGRQLADRAGLDLGPLVDAKKLPLPSYAVPASVPTVAKAVKRGNQWVVSASGGVACQPWAFATNTAESPEPGRDRAAALASRDGDRFCWD
jgi:hypothetical protein